MSYRQKSETFIYTTGIFAPVIISVTELPNVTSVHVSWNQPAGGLAIERYVVSYCQQEHPSEKETDGNCTPQSQERGNVTIGGDSTTVVLHLQADQTYFVTVTGWSGALYNTSALYQFVTNSTLENNQSIATAVTVTVVVVIIVIVTVVVVCGIFIWRYHW